MRNTYVLILLCLFHFPKAKSEWVQASKSGFKLSRQIKLIIDKDGSVSEFQEIEIERLKKKVVSPYIVLDQRTDFNYTVEGFQKHPNGKKSLLHPEAFKSTPTGLHYLDLALVQFTPGEKYTLKLKANLPFKLSHSSFWTHYNWGQQFLEKAELYILSPYPLELKANDPSASLKIKNYHNKGQYLYEVKTQKMLYHVVANDLSLRVPSEQQTWLVVSGHKKWSEFSRTLKHYLGSLPQFPHNKKALIQSVKDIPDAKAKVIALWKKLVQKKYALSSYFLTQDNSLNSSLLAQLKVLHSLLQEMSFKVDIYLMNKDPIYHLSRQSEKDIAHLIGFNHPILKLSYQQEQVWFDLSQDQVYSKHLPEEFQKRSYLSLSSPTRPLQVTQTLPLESIISEKIFHQNDDLFHHSGILVLMNHQAQQYFDMLNSHQKYEAKRSLQSLLGEQSQKFEINIKSFNATPIPRLSLKYSFLSPTSQKASHIGYLLNLPNKSLGLIFDQDFTQFQSVFPLGSLLIGEKKVRFQRIILSGAPPPSCQLKSSWMDVSRKVTYKDNNLIIEDRVQIKSHDILPKEYKTKEFKLFALSMANCFLPEDQLYRRHTLPNRFPATQSSK